MGNGDPQGLPEQEPGGSKLGRGCYRAGKMAATAGVFRIMPDCGKGEHGFLGHYNTGKIVSPQLPGPFPVPSLNTWGTSTDMAWPQPCP